LIIIGLTLLMTSMLLFIPAFSKFFLFGQVTLSQIGLSILVGFVSVMWIEIYKFLKRKKSSEIR